jgi:uncharacterized DUF497 family protein
MALLTLGRLDFEWDNAKAALNLVKHGISFSEAATTFQDPLSISLVDEDHSSVEDRLLLLGLTFQHKLVVVVHVERGARQRIISARAATPRERRDDERRD